MKRFPPNEATRGFLARSVLRLPFRPGWTRAAGGALLDLLYPRSCVSCDRPVEEKGAYRFVCDACVKLIRFACQPACGTCGYPFFGATEGELECERCAELVPRFREGRTAVILKGPPRDLVHELKYHRQIHVLRDIGRVFRESPGLVEYLRGSVLVPVPLHPRKERERGFNQSRLIARELAALAPGTEIQEPIVRCADTESQTRFDRKTRQSNLKNAFAKRPKCSLNKDHRYVLVDDVFTTGATLNSCATVLRRAGAKQVDVVTFGHG